MKTVKQWLETIADEEIREKALSNMDEDYDGIEACSLSDAIASSFSWCDSPEGEDYWINVYNSLTP